MKDNFDFSVFSGEIDPGKDQRSIRAWRGRR